MCNDVSDILDIDECASNPCNNGDCIDGENHWRCKCFPGWTGTTCDTGERSVSLPWDKTKFTAKAGNLAFYFSL